MLLVVIHKSQELLQTIRRVSEHQNIKRFVMGAILVLIVLLGTFVRVYNIDSKELWYDEAFTAKIIDNQYKEIITLSKADFHPPLYYLLLKPWVTVFGDSELSLRFPSVVFGVLTIVVAYYLAKFVTRDSKKALWVSLIIAINPFLVTYSKEARSYSLMALLIVLTTLVFLKAIEDKKYLWLSLLLPILFLTHYMAIFGIVVFAFLTLLQDKRFLVYLIPLALVILVWIPIIIGNTNSEALKWIPTLSWNRFPESVHSFVLGVSNDSNGVTSPINPFHIGTETVSLTVFVMVILLLFSGKKPSHKETLLAMCGLVPIALVVLTCIFLDKQSYLERYLIGYGALLIIYCVIIQRRLLIFLPYVLVSIYLVITFVPYNFGYRQLATHNADRPVVMASATAYINAKYYTDEIKLQHGDWKEWAIITNDDIYTPTTLTEDYYLVSVEKIEGWQPAYTVGGFNFYEYDGSD